eukprot:5971809-Prymnesium_polylepis.1
MQYGGAHGARTWYEAWEHPSCRSWRLPLRQVKGPTVHVRRGFALVDAGSGGCRPFAPLPAVLPKANPEKLRERAAALSTSECLSDRLSIPEFHWIPEFDLE